MTLTLITITALIMAWGVRACSEVFAPMDGPFSKITGETPTCRIDDHGRGVFVSIPIELRVLESNKILDPVIMRVEIIDGENAHPVASGLWPRDFGYEHGQVEHGDEIDSDIWTRDEDDVDTEAEAIHPTERSLVATFALDDESKSGGIDGLHVVWSGGEPAYFQDFDIDLSFSTDTCMLN